MSHAKVSFDTREYNANADGLGTLRLPEAMRILNLIKKQKSIKLLRQSCMVWYRLYRNPKLPFLSAFALCSG